MGHATVSRRDTLATVRLARGPVNAINGAVVEDIGGCLKRLEQEDSVKAVVLTGTGKFFSFGLDVPELYDCTPQVFTDFLVKFTDLYRYMFLYPKPIVAALNGHTIAGGCMLATACDYRVMAAGNAKISLNEITFGSSVFFGSVELLKYWVGSRNAEEILLGGAMYSAEEARTLGLIEEAVEVGDLMDAAEGAAGEFVGRYPVAYAHIKRLLRFGVVERIQAKERESIREFVDIWYSDAVRASLRQITIRG